MKIQTIDMYTKKGKLVKVNASDQNKPEYAHLSLTKIKSK